MPAIVPDARSRVDACPGVLTLHQAADGLLARVRVPGGAVTRDQLATLAAAAADFGSSGLELTSRANLQLRGIAAGAAGPLEARLAAAGLLPSASHERVRNIVASPLAGIDGSAGIDDLVGGLDRELCARPGLAALPGRFLFAVDDGRGDVAALGADVTVQVRGESAVVTSVEVARADAVPLALDLAAAFLDVRREQGSTAWRVAELDGGADALLAATGHQPSTRLVAAEPHEYAVGIVTQPDGRAALVLLAPLGSLNAAQLDFLVGAVTPRGVRITPWRSVVVPDLVDAAAVAAAAARVGFGVDAASPWNRVSACAGRPGCASALADVRADAAAHLDDWPGRQVRWSGCARRCGRPHDTDVDVIATADGYDVMVREA